MRHLLITIICLSCFGISAQTSVSFLHLGDATFQNNLLNPSLIPKGKTFIGLPVISGVHFNVNTRTSYNETFTSEGGTTLVDIDKILTNLQNQNFAGVQANINLLHLGFKLKNGALFSFTANERIEADVLYSKQLVDFTWNGNEQFTNQDIDVSKAGARGTHFREFGLGYATPVNERLTVGLRGKFLIGFADVSTPNNFKSTLNTNGEAFQLDANWENFALRRSGLDIYEGEEGSLGSHLIMNQNLGTALDVGATYHLNRYYTITGSILDVGFIGWKEDIHNETLNDTTFTYDGVQLDDLGSVRETIEDSLLDKFEPRENFDAYTSWLPTRAYGSWIYHYSQNTDFYVSGGARYIQRELKMLYGVGVTHRFGNILTASLSGTKLPQQFFNLGAAFAVDGGPVQLYMAADQVINFSVPDAKAFDFRFGINVVLNRNEDSGGSGGLSRRPQKPKAKGLDTNVFLGKQVKTKKREGIYSIIKKQKDDRPTLNKPGGTKKVEKVATGSNPYFPKDYKKLRRKERKRKRGTNKKRRKRTLRGN